MGYPLTGNVTSHGRDPLAGLDGVADVSEQFRATTKPLSLRSKRTAHGPHPADHLRDSIGGWVSGGLCSVSTRGRRIRRECARLGLWSEYAPRGTVEGLATTTAARSSSAALSWLHGNSEAARG